MTFTLTHILPSRKAPRSPHAEALVQEFLERANRLTPTVAAGHASEAAFLDAAARVGGRAAGRGAATLILCDSRGATPTSEEFAGSLAGLRDAGAQHIWLAIGPADGWSAAALARAALTVSFGRITLPHALARVVAAEQLYRALTIHARHPYHLGHL